MNMNRLLWLGLVALLLGRLAGLAIPAEGIDPIIEQIRTWVGTYIPLIGDIACLGFMGYGGILWATAGPNQSKVKKAKDTIKNAAIGFAICTGVVTFNLLLGDLVAELLSGIGG